MVRSINAENLNQWAVEPINMRRGRPLLNSMRTVFVPMGEDQVKFLLSYPAEMHEVIEREQAVNVATRILEDFGVETRNFVAARNWFDLHPARLSLRLQLGNVEGDVSLDFLNEFFGQEGVGSE